MSRYNTLTSFVDRLYLEKAVSREEFCDYLYSTHVKIVAAFARQYANRFSVHEELCCASALLHDCADAVVGRSEPDHESISATIASQLLEMSGFTAHEIEIIVGDALRFHSCRGDERPKTDVGRVLASADAAAHLTSDFYAFALKNLHNGEAFDAKKTWLLAKLERDFHNKLLFSELQQEMRVRYKQLKRAVMDATSIDSQLP